MLKAYKVAEVSSLRYFYTLISLLPLICNKIIGMLPLICNKNTWMLPLICNKIIGVLPLISSKIVIFALSKYMLYV